MKDKNLPNDYNSLSLEELTKEANKMIEDLENQKNLENSDLQRQQQVHFLYFVWFCIFSEFSLSKAEIKG